MKKIFFLLTVLTALLPLGAADIFKFCPNDANGALYLDFKAVFSHPRLSAVLKRDDVQKVIREKSMALGENITQWDEALAFFALSGDSSLAGFLVRSAALKYIPSWLALSGCKYSSAEINGKDCFVIEDPYGATEKNVLTELAPDVMLLTTEKDFSKIISLPRGNPAALPAMRQELPRKDAPVWLVADIMMPPLDGTPGVMQKYSLRLSGYFSPDGNTYALDGYLLCPDKNIAQSLAMMGYFYTSSVSAALFNRDEKLGRKVMKIFKFKPEGNKLVLRGKVNHDFIVTVLNYLEKNADMLQSFAGVNF